MESSSSHPEMAPHEYHRDKMKRFVELSSWAPSDMDDRVLVGHEELPGLQYVLRTQMYDIFDTEISLYVQPVVGKAYVLELLDRYVPSNFETLPFDDTPHARLQLDVYTDGREIFSVTYGSGRAVTSKWNQHSDIIIKDFLKDNRIEQHYDRVQQ